jgi:UDP-N-acetylglucosamine 2-epimerase (non-hydrolysing)
MGIPVYHMEAGNRCFDERVPEETNRRIIDSFSKYNLPYTENSKQNLLSEGYHKNYVFKTGNPIFEVLQKFESSINSSKILDELGLQSETFVLVTTHRAENVDNESSLTNIIQALKYTAKKYKVIFSVHPRTRSKLRGFDLSDNIILSEPFGFFDFVHLEKTAKVVISDSGTVQEECCIYGVPSITIRRTTERQETIECGSNLLVGTDYVSIKNGFESVLNRNNSWQPPQDYLIENVSDIVVNILLGGK